MRVLEPIPRRVHARIGESVCAGEVDHDPTRRRLETRGLFVRETDERHVRAT
jgi:hypothetical protein